MRLAAPAHLVDINRLAELAYVRADGRRRVVVGALARHADVERRRPAYDVQPLLRQALRLVAHPVIRNRGTTVGSLAHADPSGEMTAVLALTGGIGAGRAARRRQRDVAAAEFFAGPLESASRPGSWRCRRRSRRSPPGSGHGVRRGGPPARRLRGLRAGGRGDGGRRRGRRRPGGVRLGGPDPAGARPHRGGRRRRARRRPTGPRPASWRWRRSTPSRTSTPPPTTGGTWSGADRPRAAPRPRGGPRMSDGASERCTRCS